MKGSFGRRIVFVLLVMVGVVVVVVSRRGRDEHRVSAGPAPAPAAAAAPSPGLPTAVPEPAIPGAGDPAQGDDYEDHPLADVMHKVLANDHQLNTFMYFYNRPLLGEADQAKYHALLSDRSLFAGVEHDLLYPEETKADKPGNIKRLMKIDYLREALAWKDNPARAELIASIVRILLTDNYPPDMTMDMRLSLSGNKMELFEMLTEIAPDQAAAVVQASRGTRQERLIAYIANTLEVRKQIAANAESVVTPGRH